MKTIHILCDQREVVAKILLKFSQGKVGGVGLGLVANSSAVEIPAPYFEWHLAKVTPRGQLLGLVYFGPDGPITLFTSKGWNTTFGRNTGSC